MDGCGEFTLDKPLKVPFPTLWLQHHSLKANPFASGVVSSFFTHGNWWAHSRTYKHQVPPLCLTPGTCLTNSGYFLKQMLFSIIYSPSPSHASVSSRMEATHRNLPFVIFQNGPKGAWIPCRLTLLSWFKHSFLKWEEISQGKCFSIKNDMYVFLAHVCSFACYES